MMDSPSNERTVCFMGIFRRARRYLTRKKGKAIILFLLFLLVSVLLLTGFSILSGTDQAAKDLRSNIGAAFYIRPYEQLEFNSGQVSSTGTPTITQQSIDEVITAIGGELKAYNTEHYGYAKGEDLSFVPGIKHNEENNMGQVMIHPLEDWDSMDTFSWPDPDDPKFYEGI